MQIVLSDLHGDSVATSYVPGGSDATTIDAWSDYLEYGAPRDAASARNISSQSGYDWDGSHQRATDIPSGLTLMGERLYNNNTGRFTSVDPIVGGNDNTYNYPNDPVNESDLFGLSHVPRKKVKECEGEADACHKAVDIFLDVCRAGPNPNMICEAVAISAHWGCNAIYKRCIERAFRIRKKSTISWEAWSGAWRMYNRLYKYQTRCT